MVSEEGKSTAGVHLDAEGNRVVGGSVRADGSVRKIVKVRPGFTPQEDVKRYNVREAREERLRSTSQIYQGGKAIQNASRDPQRPSRFSGLNNFLKGVASEDAKGTRRSESSSGPLHIPPNHRHSVATQQSDDTDISNSLAKLSIEGDQKGDVDKKSVAKHQESSSPDSIPNQKSKKAYVPPQRRKKYTLADLDSQKT
ncbi:CYFA0S05e03180g1_1 [Cyberlindnera fabianii]|uniref:CYFA0S05e03180g1_1 n=1 Tax=Cyberlindnera fabianii TaxID=36022 RepID=A0A061AZ56_CYBFA|nr:CYFA0S05e03180g1_1 [Cyberlindnera fabianii]